jgi:hypothetical protein
MLLQMAQDPHIAIPNTPRIVLPNQGGTNYGTFSTYDKDRDGNLTLCRRVKFRNNRVNQGAAIMLPGVFSAPLSVAFNIVALSTNTAALNALTDTAATFQSGGEITASGMAAQVASFTSYTAPTASNGNASFIMSSSYQNDTGSTITVGTLGLKNNTTPGSGQLLFETLMGTTVPVLAAQIAVLAWVFNQ